jgi:hypothetical protein
MAKLNPATKSGEYLRQADYWKMVDTLLGGTSAMRAARGEYMPAHGNETDTEYDNRVKTAVLLNEFKRVLNSLAGRPFQEPINLNEDVPELIKEFAEDVNMLGDNLTVFCANWLKPHWLSAWPMCWWICRASTKAPKATRRAHRRERWQMTYRITCALTPCCCNPKAC